jgi:hypothetical protein
MSNPVKWVWSSVGSSPSSLDRSQEPVTPRSGGANSTVAPASTRSFTQTRSEASAGRKISEVQPRAAVASEIAESIEMNEVRWLPGYAASWIMRTGRS